MEVAALCSPGLPTELWASTEPCVQRWRPWLPSEGRHAPELTDDVSQPLGQPSPAWLFHVKGSGQQVVEGAVAHCHHGAGQADDVIRHAEVWRRQVHQQWLRVEAHEIAGAIGGREAGEGKQEG